MVQDYVATASNHMWWSAARQKPSHVLPASLVDNAIVEALHVCWLCDCIGYVCYGELAKSKLNTFR